jgi:hypothetical protein
MLHRVPDFDGFFGMTQATENGHEILNVEYKECICRSGLLKTVAR